MKKWKKPTVKKKYMLDTWDDLDETDKIRKRKKTCASMQNSMMIML